MRLKGFVCELRALCGETVPNQLGLGVFHIQANRTHPGNTSRALLAHFITFDGPIHEGCHADSLFTPHTGLGTTRAGLSDNAKAAEHFDKAI